MESQSTPGTQGKPTLQPHSAPGPAVLYTTHFHVFQIPDLGLRGFLQVEDLIQLIPPHNFDGSVQLCAFFLLHQQRTIRTAQQSCGAGNRLKGIVCLLLSGAMFGQNTDTVLISKPLDPADDLIITGITVHFTAYLTDFLHSVNDDGIGVRVLLHKILQLFIQPIPNLSSGGGEVEVGVSFTPYIINIQLWIR